MTDGGAMSKSGFSRRMLLSGLGGVALTLPMLQIFREKEARAAAAPMRYLIIFAGMAGNRDGGDGGNLLQPAALGANYALGPALMPLATRGVQDRVSIVSGLRMDRGNGPGCAGLDWHQSSVGGLISGARWIPDPNLPP